MGAPNAKLQQRPQMFVLSLFSSLEMTKPTCIERSWPQISTALRAHKENARKEDAQLFSPAQFVAGGSRNKSDVALVGLCVFDIDCGSDLRAAADALEKMGYPVVLYTTHSHSPDEIRYRLVFPLTRPVRGIDWPAFHAAATNMVETTFRRFGVELVVDQKCKDAGRAYFFPSHAPGADFFAEVYNEWNEMLDPKIVTSQFGSKPRIDNMTPVIEPIESDYVNAAIDDEIAKLSTARPGEQSDQLNKSSFNLGSLLAGARRTDRKREIWERILEAVHRWECSRGPWTEVEIDRTFNSGWNSGVAQPRDLSHVRAGRAQHRQHHDRHHESRSDDGDPEPASRVIAGNFPSSPKIDIKEPKFIGGLDEPEPQRWVVPGWIPRGFVTTLFAHGGSSKSFVASHIATQVARRGQLFGIPIDEFGPALYADGELNQSAWLSRMFAISRGLGIDSPPPNVAYFEVTKSLLDPRTHEMLANWIQKHQPALTVIDSFTACLPGEDSNSNDDVALRMKSLGDFGTVLLIDHTPKAAAIDVASPLGSVAKQNLSRSIIQIASSSAGGSVLRHVKNTFGPLQDAITFAMTFSGNSVEFNRIGSDDERLEGVETVLPAKSRITALFTPGGEYFMRGATAREIAETTGLPLKTVKNSLTVLKRRGDVFTDGQTWRAARSGAQEES